MAQTRDEQALKSGVSRRRFLQGVGAAGAGAVMADAILSRAADAPATDAPATEPSGATSGESQITLRINGQDRKVVVEPRTTLLIALRDRLDPALTGPKLVCDAGSCGACTVLHDGKAACSCLILAVDAVGHEITTVEGLGQPGNLNPIQQAFCDKDGMQCGYCTDGFIVSLTAFLRDNPNPTLDEVKQGCHGNFCRCGSYPHIFEAALQAAGKFQKA
jgi:xanthine dehydrogenase YagT iron-sulfur-binding subunit